MSHEQISIAIAESCGLHVCPGCFHQIDPDCCCCGDRITHYPDEHHPIPMGCTCGYDDAENRKAPQPCCPNYTASLDACAEFESKLTDEQWLDYMGFLSDVVLNHSCSMVASWNLTRRLLESTPSHRCEAYLRVIGAWKESNQQPA